jgi:hypothetical protein
MAATLLVVLGGCAVLAPKAEYRDYRAVRLASDDSERLLAMQRYVARHPDGRWYDEVQGERARREQAVFEAGKSDRAGLVLYMSAFPDGSFAGQARSRLSAIALIEDRKRQEAALAVRMAQERKLRDAELTRTWVSRFLSYWARTLVQLQGWGTPIEQVARTNAEFSRAFGRAPRPRCTTDECVKYYESAYAVPVPGGTRIERAMNLVLRLRLAQGQLTRAELLLPSWGFSRWHELEERSVVVDGDPEARARAVQWAMTRVLAALDPIAKDRTALADYVLAEIGKPAIGPSGELLDTTAEDPGAPSNRISDTPGAAPSPEPGIEELVKPTAPEAAPDMELAPLRVGASGATAPPPELVLPPVAVAQPGAATPELVLDPVAVGSAGSTTPAPATPQPTSAPAAPSPRELRAFQAGDLRIVIVAAGAGEGGPAYDALVIETVPPPATPKRAVDRVRPKAVR